MAAIAAAAVAIPSFTGLKVESVKTKPCSYTPVAKASVPMARASLKDNMSKMGVALVAASASVMMASNANAVEVLMGGSGGELAFIPNELQVNAGEQIVFKNNAGFPHNVIFDEDAVPAGVDVSSISMSEEDLLNAPGLGGKWGNYHQRKETNMGNDWREALRSPSINGKKIFM